MSAVSNGCIIDEHCENKSGEILIDSSKSPYSCTLNQTDIKDNKNKFYVMQLIKDGSNYIHFIRYGRVGEPGKSSHKRFTTENESIKSFEKQFRSKTRNHWVNRATFEKKEGKYFFTEISYEKELQNINLKGVKTPDCSLDDRLQQFMRMISDVKMMQSALVDLEVDTKKMPLGKISPRQITKAQSLIGEIRLKIDIINKSKDASILDTTNSELVALSSKFYTFIPYACGRRKPPIINNSELVDKFNNMTDDLNNLVIATKIIKKQTADVHPLDRVYSEIKTKIVPVDKHSDTWNEIEKYVVNTHAPTHHFKTELVDIFEIERKGEFRKFKKFSKEIDNRQLLIHGSRMSNWCSILQQGLLLDPSRLGVKITGKMFGYGVYFANSFSKSTQYCGVSYGNGFACLALAEVALGDECKKTTSDFYMSKKKLDKDGYDSTWGQGNMTPSSETILDGITIPNGKLIKSNVNSVLRYDEKIVYDGDQFRLKYLVIIKTKY
jgi:predicted DNA-binding WGR domain protein